MGQAWLETESSLTDSAQQVRSSLFQVFASGLAPRALVFDTGRCRAGSFRFLFECFFLADPEWFSTDSVKEVQSVHSFVRPKLLRQAWPQTEQSLAEAIWLDLLRSSVCVRPGPKRGGLQRRWQNSSFFFIPCLGQAWCETAWNSADAAEQATLRSSGQGCNRRSRLRQRRQSSLGFLLLHSGLAPDRLGGRFRVATRGPGCSRTVKRSLQEIGNTECVEARILV